MNLFSRKNTKSTNLDFWVGAYGFYGVSGERGQLISSSSNLKFQINIFDFFVSKEQYYIDLFFNIIAFQAFPQNLYLIWTFFPKKGPKHQILAFLPAEGILGF